MSDSRMIAKEIYNAITPVRRNDQYDQIQERRFIDTVAPIIDHSLPMTISEQEEILSYIRGDYHMDKIPIFLANLIIDADRAMMNVERLQAQVADLRAALDEATRTIQELEREASS